MGAKAKRGVEGGRKGRGEEKVGERERVRQRHKQV